MYKHFHTLTETLVCLVLVRITTGSYMLKCPDSSQWKLRAKGLCNATNPWYYCLFNENKSRYKELCADKQAFHKPGYKYVVSGNINGKPCDRDRFQPFKFGTDGNSECIFKRSSCVGEGQIIYGNGTTTTDLTCRCNHYKEFAFISATKHLCYCNPLHEDCSCYKKSCDEKEILTSDYDCLRIVLAVGDFTCANTNSIRRENEYYTTTTTTTTASTDNRQYFHTTNNTKYITLLIILSTLIVAVICFFLIDERCIKECRKFGNIEKEIKIRVEEQVAEIQKETFLRMQKEIEERLKEMKTANPVKEEEDNDRVPKKTRDVFTQHIKEWVKDDQKFIETRAAIQAEHRLRDNNCLLISGSSGNGKSAISRHLSLKLRAGNNFEIIPIVMGPFDIFKFRNQNRKQVFVIDDFCGKAIVNAQFVDVWASHIDEVFNLLSDVEAENKINSVKFLFATRDDVYNDKIFNRLKSLKRFDFKLADLPLQDEEKLKMIKKYISPDEESRLSEKLTSDRAYFPLLCKIAEGKPADQSIRLFRDLSEFIKQQMLSIKEKHSLQFCIITLCALFDNNLREDMFDEKVSCETEKLVFSEICVEFNLAFHKNSALDKMKEQLKKPDDMYMTKTGNAYHFLHGEVYHIAELICGQTVINTFIKFAVSSAIAERFCLKSTITEEKKNVIFIDQEDMEKKYFDRLITDLEKGITYSIFHNNQLGNELYRQKFCAYCRNRKSKLVQLLKQLKDKNGTACNNEKDTSDKKGHDYEDYIDFEKQYHFSTHEMCIPLIESAWEGFEDVVEMLIEMECDINGTDKFGRTALFVASKLGKLKVVISLLSKGADSSLCDCEGQYPLLIACKEGYDEVVEVLLQQTTDINRCDSKGTSPLIAASYAGKQGIVKMLVTAEADIAICNNKGQSPLFVAASNGRKDVVEFLIKTSHEEISKTDNDGRSPLLIACQNRQQSVVDSLIQEHCDISQCNWEKQSPLYIACAEGFTEIVNALVEGGADKGQRDEDGRTPLFIACERGRTDIVKILIDSGADISTTDNNKRSPFYAACRQGSLEIVKLLSSEEGVDVSGRTKWGCTPLFTARREGHHDIVKYLLGLGVDDS